jgi:hypothetical protein
MEINGRGMLYLHCLIWLNRNLDFQNLQEHLQLDTDFAAKIICYLESIIKYSVNLAANDLNNQRQNPAPPLAKDTESNSSFITSLLLDINTIASKW